MRGKSLKRTIRILVFAAVICLTAVLCACSSGGSYSISGKLTRGDLSFSGEYKSFDGYYFVTWKLPQNERGYFEIKTDTESGSISFFISDSNDSEKEISDGEVYEMKRGDSDIKVIVRAEEHAGGFSVKFKTLK